MQLPNHEILRVALLRRPHTCFHPPWLGKQALLAWRGWPRRGATGRESAGSMQHISYAMHTYTCVPGAGAAEVYKGIISTHHSRPRLQDKLRYIAPAELRYVAPAARRRGRQHLRTYA
eukprot:5381771-Pleurochrysis_carterae.AAC.1